MKNKKEVNGELIRSITEGGNTQSLPFVTSKTGGSPDANGRFETLPYITKTGGGSLVKQPFVPDRAGTDTTATGTGISSANNKGLPYKEKSWEQRSADMSAQADKYYSDYLAGRGNFDYDWNSDEIMKALEETYRRNAKRAADNADANAALRTGGYSNSYGASAGAQAYNDSMQGLYETIPQREAEAYARWQAEQAEKLAAADRAYNISQDYYNRGFNERQYADERADTDWQRAFTEQQYADERADTDWQKGFTERQYADERSDTQWAQDMEAAQLAAKFSDYSLLNDMGIDTAKFQSIEEHNNALAEALELAQLGSYGALEALGYDMTNAKAAIEQAKKDSDFEKSIEIGKIYAAAGDYSILRQLAAKLNITAGGGSYIGAGTGGSSGTGGGARSTGTSYSGSGSYTPAAKEEVPVIDPAQQKTYQAAYDSLNEADKWVVDRIAAGYDPKWALGK